MPYGPGAKAEVLSILAFRAYPVNRGFETGRVEVTENPPFPTALPIAVLVAALVPTATFGQRTTLVSPELHKDGSVTFRLERPGAHEVLVALAGLEAPLKMTQTEGVWSVTSASLASGTYWYSYLVDGKAELDPLNADVIPNYAYLNSVVRVIGGSQPWEPTDVPHGEVHRHFYESKVVKGLPGGRSEYFVYTPPGYDARASISSVKAVESPGAHIWPVFQRNLPRIKDNKTIA
jgi:hypothetical protein